WPGYQLADVAELGCVTRPAPGAGQQNHREPSWSMADGGRALFPDERARGEPFQAEGGDDVGWLAGRDVLGHRLARHRGRLEPVGAPADVDEEAVDRGGAHDRREVGRHVAQSRPLPQQPDLGKRGHELEHVPGETLDEFKRAAHRVGRERIHAGTEHKLAAVGLAYIYMQRAGHDDRAKEWLDRLRKGDPARG